MAQESSWEPVSGSLECPVWVDGWHHLYQRHLTVVTLKRAHQSTEYKEQSQHCYEAQVVICKDIY